MEKVEEKKGAALDRMLTVEAVLSLVPYSRIHLNRMVRAGDFPAPLQLGAGRVAFRESEVREWLDSRPPATSSAWRKESAR